MSTESAQEFEKLRDQASFEEIMKNEHYLINRLTLEDKSTPEKISKKCTRLSIVGNIDFDMFTINYIDGFHVKNKFLLVNNPLSEMNSYIFWSWVWDIGCNVIVRFDKKSKNHHWLNKDKYTVGEFIIQNEIIVDKHYTQFKLTVNNLMERKSRIISHYQYHEFPDRNAALNSRQFKNFLKILNQKQNSYCVTVEGKESARPIVIHSVGCFERAVTTCALDICFDQLQKTKSVSVPNVLLKIKSQVFFESFSLEEYKIINRVLLDSIRDSNLKEEKLNDCNVESASFRQRVRKYCLLFKRASVP